MSRGIEIAAWCGVVRDGEMKTSAAGNTYGLVTLSTESGEIDDQGKPALAFLRVMAFKGLATVAANLRKGQRAYIEGAMRARIYAPENGPPKLDLSVRAFKLEPTRIGKSRPPRGDGGASYHAPLERRERQSEFNDEIGF
jgi:single-stranded DNA-binding protein